MAYFKDLEIGTKFEVFGDEHICYDFPKICKCIKIKKNTGQEIDTGMNFCMEDYDHVDTVK